MGDMQQLSQGEMALYVIGYFIGVLLVGMAGAEKKVGSLMAGVIALVFTPLAGAFVVLASKNSHTEQFEKAMLEYLKQKGIEQKEDLTVKQAKELLANQV